MKSRLPLIIGGIVGGSLLAFLCGMIFTVMVIMPAREWSLEMAGATTEPTIQASPTHRFTLRPETTPQEASPTPTFAVIILTPEPAQPTPTSSLPGATATLVPSITTTPVRRPTTVRSPTSTPRFSFYYVEGSRVPEENCFSQYLTGWVRDANGAPLNGVTVRWERWGEAFFEVSGDPAKAWRQGEWKFTYGYGQPGFDATLATDFTLQIVTSEENPEPQSELLVIHYAGCFETGQITNIVFKRR